MKNKGKLIELMLCITLGSVVTLLLFKVAVTTMKPLAGKLEEIKNNNMEYGVMLEGLNNEILEEN